MLNHNKYVTRRQWGEHPIGSECFVWRDEVGVLHLEFDNGETFSAEGYYAEGIEFTSPLERLTSPLERLAEQVRLDIDKQIMEEMFAIEKE